MSTDAQKDIDDLWVFLKFGACTRHLLQRKSYSAQDVLFV